MNVRVADLNMPVARIDDRRLEVVANGISFFGGMQLAVDTTLVSPLDSQSWPCCRAGQFAGAVMLACGRNAYPHLVTHQDAILLC